MRRHTSSTILLGAALLIAGFLGGMVATSGGLLDAAASPGVDASRNTFATGDATTLTLWKVKGGEIEEAIHYQTQDGAITESRSLPAASTTPPKGANTKSCGSCGGGGSCG